MTKSEASSPCKSSVNELDDVLLAFFIIAGLTKEGLEEGLLRKPSLWARYKSWSSRLPSQKYRLTDNEVVVTCPIYRHPVRLRQIQALQPLKGAEGLRVKKGDLGGFIQSEANLSQTGNAWVSDEAHVFGNARVVGDALVRDSTRVYGNAIISDFAIVADHATVSGNAVLCDRSLAAKNASIYGQGVLCDSAIVTDSAVVSGTACVSKWARVEGHIHLTQGSTSEATLVS